MLGCATMATAAVLLPSYGFYAKRSGKVLFDGGSVEVVLVVSCSRHDK